MEEAEQYCFEDFESQPIGTGSTTAYRGGGIQSSLQEKNAGDQPVCEQKDSLQNMAAIGRTGTNGYDVERRECTTSDSKIGTSSSAKDRTNRIEEIKKDGSRTSKPHVYGDPLYVNSVGGISGFVSRKDSNSKTSEKRKPVKVLQRQSASVDEDVFSVRTRATPSIVHAKPRIAKWTVTENEQGNAPARTALFHSTGAKRTSTGLVSVSPVDEAMSRDKPRPYIGLVRSTTIDIPSIGCSSTDDDGDEDQNSIPFNVFDKLSVRARPNVKSSSKTKDVAIPPPQPRTNTSSPRNWDFATQSIVPRFAKRDDSEIVSAIRKSPTPRGSVEVKDGKRRPLMTTAYSIDSALMPLTDSPHKGHKIPSPDDLTYDSNDKITFYGPGDVIRGAASEQSAVQRRTNTVNKEKRRQIVSMGSIDGIMGLPPSGKQKGMMGNAMDDGNIPQEWMETLQQSNDR